MADDDEVRIRGEFENNISRPADAAARSIDNIGDEAAETAVQLEAMEAAESSAAITTRQLGNETDAASEKIKKKTRTVRRDTEEVKRNDRETTRLIRNVRRFGNANAFLGRGLQGVSRMAVSVRRGLTMAFGPLAMVTKIGAMIEAVGLLAVGLKGLGAAGLVAANGLGPLVGILGAYPAALAGMATGVGAIKIGTSGLGKAWSTMNNPKAKKEDVQKANKGVAPEALEFLRALKKLQPEWIKLRKEVQQKLFMGLGKEIQPLVKKWLPILEDEFGRTASGVNKLLKEQIKWLKSADGIQTVSYFLDDGRKNFLALLRVLAAFGKVFAVIAHQASPMFRQMMKDLEGLLGRLYSWLKKNDQFMRSFFLKSWQRLKGILFAAWNFALGLIGVLKAATPWTNKMGKQLTKVAVQFNKWANSKKGQAQLRKFYSEFMPVFYALLGLAGQVIRFLWSIGSSKEFIELIKKIQTDLLPAVEKVVKASQGKFIPAIIDIFSALADIASSGFIEIFAGFLEDIAGYIRKFADWFKRQSPETKRVVVGLVATFFLFGRLLAPLGKAIEGFGKIVGKFAGKGGLLGKLVGGGGKTKEMGKIAGFLARLAPLLGGLASPAGVVLAVIVGLIAIFTALYVKFQGFRDAVNQIGQRIAEVWLTMVWPTIKTVMGLIGQLADWLLQKLGIDGGLPELGTKIAEAWQKIWPVISFLIGAWGASLAIVVAVIGGVIAVIMLIVAAWIKAGQAVVTFFAWSIAKAQQFRGWINGLLGRLFMGIVNLWRGPVSGFIGWIKGVFRTGIDAIGTAVGKIKGFFSTAIARAKEIIETLVGKVQSVADRIGTIISGITDAVGGAVQWVTDHIPGFFAGGTMVKGQLSLVGEHGPEALMDRSGRMGLVGLNGPQLIMPDKPYAVVNNAATEDPFSMWSHNSPSWAVKAMQKAYSASGHTSTPEASPARRSEPVAPHIDNSTTLTIEKVEIGSKDDLDEFEDRLERMLRKIARDKKRNS